MLMGKPSTQPILGGTALFTILRSFDEPLGHHRKKMGREPECWTVLRLGVHLQNEVQCIE
ncbi:hypothetical protein Hanom_Chr01g00030471 [Helianthus anomalus]